MSLHNLFDRHVPDFKRSRWDGDRFITECLICGREMVKRADLGWKIVKT
jgi:hypothetical protein